jgi:hypothetical protein
LPQHLIDALSQRLVSLSFAKAFAGGPYMDNVFPSTCLELRKYKKQSRIKVQLRFQKVKFARQILGRVVN